MIYTKLLTHPNIKTIKTKNYFLGFARYMFLVLGQHDCKDAGNARTILSIDALPDAYFIERLQTKPILNKSAIQEQLQDFPERATLAIVTKATKMCLKKVFFDIHQCFQDL